MFTLAQAIDKMSAQTTAKLEDEYVTLYLASVEAIRNVVTPNQNQGGQIRLLNGESVFLMITLKQRVCKDVDDEEIFAVACQYLVTNMFSPVWTMTETVN